MHKADIVNVRKLSYGDVKKLKVIHDHNQKMGGVDENDAMTGSYSSIRKTYKWYVKIFLHFLEEALFNAFVVCSKEGEKKITKFMPFKLEVIREMLEDAQKMPADSEFDRLKGHHFLSVIPSSKSKEKPQKRCVVCYKNKVRKESRYHCKNCQDHPGLCPAPCFMRYHTQIDFCKTQIIYDILTNKYFFQNSL